MHLKWKEILFLFIGIGDITVLQPHTTMKMYQNVVEYFLLDLKAN